LRAGKQIILEVNLRQTVPGAEGCQVHVAHPYPRKHPVKWWVGVCTWLRRLWLAHEYVSVPKTLTIRLGFVLPEGTHKLTLYVNCDSYMGLEENINLGEIVVGS
jgi:pre-mRNA-splicing helicase BRR2